MSDRKLAKAVQTLFKQVRQLCRTTSRAFINWLLRTALVANRRTRPVAGFVLPTTVLLILVVALTAGALTYRAFNTSTRTISETQNRVIYNAASPAIDRARAKVEFLFDSTKDTRFPGGVPSADYLVSMLLNNGTSINGGTAAPQLTLNGTDPYTLPDELTWGKANGFATGRLDSNGDGTPDNTWGFRADTNGDGTTDATVVYSIVFSIPANSGNTQGWQRLVALSDSDKAKGIAGTDPRSPVPYARSGPLSNSPSAANCSGSGSSGSSVEGGWYQDAANTSVLRRNFQVDAFVLPDSATQPGGSNNFATLEFQQDRILNRGNKWGAWFRNDLEIFPGPPFQWNGAMHTEGNLIVGNSSFSAYLISSPNSCLWYESASEITVTDVTPTQNGQDFQGQMVSGKLNDNALGGQSLVYIWSQNFSAATSRQTLTSGTDSVSSGTPYNLSIDPLTIQTTNGYTSRVSTNNRSSHNAAYDTGTIHKRMFNRTETAPYVDDTYRADDRYGPKQKYSGQVQIPSGKKVGDLIAATDNVSTNPTALPILANPTLTAQDDPNAKPGDTPNLGLDGYWERRARFQGLRVLVGQRLELGNTFGWVPPQDRPDTITSAALEQTYLQSSLPAETFRNGMWTNGGDGDPSDLRDVNYTATTTPSNVDPDKSDNEGDPLYSAYLPGTQTSLTHESRQRRALRDNLAAVQSTAVYHSAVDKDYPVACFASTVHPGSPLTLQQSLNFVPTSFIDSSFPSNQIDPATPSISTQRTALIADFFNGRGTDGWEFDGPDGNRAKFINDIDNPDSPLRIALQNLAQFAGDHVNDNQTGAFPPTQEAGQIHPNPELAMWGSFANLRRTLAQLSTVGYSNLSIADKTYLHTASCTLGMLAYNIDRVQRFDPRNFQNDAANSNLLQQVGLDLYTLMDGVVDDVTNFEVLPKGRLATYNYDPTVTVPVSTQYNPRDYDRVPAEAFLGKYREYIAASGTVANPSNDPRYRVAELIFTYFQIRRDRTYGFRPSPAANTWNYNPFVVQNPGNGLMTLWSSACDPNVFAMNTSAQGRKTDANGAQFLSSNPALSDPVIGVYRLALSRLCGTVIPPAATRNYPGDLTLPARGGSVANAQFTAYIPTYGGTLAKEVQPTAEAVSKTNAAFTSATSPLNNTGTPFTVNSTASPGANNTAYPYLNASVAPKWPSLFYLFPEVTHNLGGDILDTGNDGIGINNSDKNWEDDVDYRQPNGLLTIPGTNTLLPAAFQPWTEPYIRSNYIANTANPSATYRVVDATPVTLANLSYQTPSITFTAPQDGTIQGGATATYSYVYKVNGNRIPDLSVANIALQPHRLPAGFSNPFSISGNTTWQLPVTPLSSVATSLQNIPPNRITVPRGDTGLGDTAVVPFLDRAIFNGREWMPVRVMDFDLGFLRRIKVSDTVTVLPVTPTVDNAADVWLPISGIVYAFREDSVREDAINRPPAGTYTNATNPASATDPAVTTGTLVSVKPVDGVPDPDRRPHGFRLRNGTQLKRHANTNVPAQDNIRGLSFFTDDPLYIMGYFNLHQTGGDDVGDPTDPNTRLEEFTERLPSTGAYNETDFYSRQTRDGNFASRDNDRWRPAEILADSVSILSNNFCDGSILDTFMVTGSAANGAKVTTTTYSGRNRTDSGIAFPAGFNPYRVSTGNTGGASVYTTASSALYGPGCTNNGVTSFLNQNFPKTTLPTTPTVGGATAWSWMRENPYDIFSPIKVSRNGDGMVIQSQVNARTASTGEGLLKQKPLVPIPYTSTPVSGGYYTAKDGRSTQTAQATRVNTIMVSGLIPSRNGQSYGGLHNFPRFLENWSGIPLWFAGSFLQLNFSNYATAPFDLQVWEPGTTPALNNETIPYYGAPSRLWGYDVALQKSPAGPAAARFVTATKDRNEFYKEPAANDPYIRNLCLALPNSLFPDTKCPS